MALDYSEIVDAVKKHFVKVVYSTEPSKSHMRLPSWKKYKGQNLSVDKTNRNRQFDVEESEEGGEVIFVGNGTDDYDVMINIEVCYDSNNRMNTVAMGDYGKVRFKLENANDETISALGFNYLQVQDAELDPVDEDDEFRFLTIPVKCRVSVNNYGDATIEFLGVYKDLEGDSDVYKDSTGVNIDVYKDV